MNIEGATVEATKEVPVNKDMAAEIEEAVMNEAPPEEEKTGEETPAENTPKEGEEKPADQVDDEGRSDEAEKGEESPSDDPSGDEKPAEEDEAETEELLTRAVRSGMSLKDAKMMVRQDAEALERNITLLETASKPSDEPAGDGDESAAEKSADEDPLEGIPDLDPDQYDETLVSVVQGLKSIVKGQHETIKQLKSSGGEKKDTWFDSQVEALQVKDLGQKDISGLKNQYDILKAGHEAQGSKVSDADIFQQASQLALGDKVKAAKDADIKTKLEKREQQHTERPGGHSVKPKGDALQEVAEEVDKKFFGKK